MSPDLQGPAVGVGALLIHDGRVLLIRRGKEPLRGRWTLPGGTVELGETLEAALIREVEEETGLRVRPRETVLVFDRILRAEGRVSYHYVIVDYLCDYESGSPRAGSDAEAVTFATPGELAGYDLPEQTLEVVVQGFRRAGISVAGLPATRQAVYDR